MELTESVARAICKTHACDDEVQWWNTTVERYVDDHWTGYIIDADAAIKAISEYIKNYFSEISLTIE